MSLRQCQWAIVICASTLWVCLAAPAAEAGVTRGPYLQQVDQQANTRSVLIVIELDTASALELRYGDGLTASSSSATHHEVALTGLSPDTRYDYSVHADGVELSTGHAFWTAVEPGSPFRMVLYGDTRTQPDRHMEVVGAIVGEAANLLVHTGDLVADGEVDSQWDEFFAIEAPLLSQVPLYPAVGNHDEYDGDAALFRSIFALPATELYYSFDYGNAHFIAIDGHARIDPLCRIDDQVVSSCLDEAQRAWLEADLRAAANNPETQHIFVLTHVGPYSSKAGREGSQQMRVLLPLFERCGVTAILSGHDHYYERGESESGLPYVISGGAGAPIYEIAEPSPQRHRIHAQAQAHHYVVIDIAGTTAEVTAKRPDGTVVDRVVWRAPSPIFSDGDCTLDPGLDPEPQPAAGCGAGSQPGSLLLLLVGGGLLFGLRRCGCCRRLRGR